MSEVITRLIHDNFENARQYNIPHAQLIIADIPYCVANNMYASNPMWYNNGDNKQGESKLAHKAAFNSDYSFNINNFSFSLLAFSKRSPLKAKRERRA